MYELVLKEKPTLLVWNYFELQICVDVTLSSYLLYHEQQCGKKSTLAMRGNMPNLLMHIRRHYLKQYAELIETQEKC